MDLIQRIFKDLWEGTAERWQASAENYLGVNVNPMAAYDLRQLIDCIPPSLTSSTCKLRHLCMLWATFSPLILWLLCIHFVVVIDAILVVLGFGGGSTGSFWSSKHLFLFKNAGRKLWLRETGFGSSQLEVTRNYTALAGSPSPTFCAINQMLCLCFVNSNSIQVRRKHCCFCKGGQRLVGQDRK